MVLLRAAGYADNLRFPGGLPRDRLLPKPFVPCPQKKPLLSLEFAQIDICPESRPVCQCRLESEAALSPDSRGGPACSRQYQQLYNEIQNSLLAPEDWRD